jgi:UTP:GlnB (protein PII) uridylyltransferase
LGGQPPLSVVAVGGYGRGDLSPHSDVDLLFLVAPKSDVTKGTLRGLLYPLWDAGWQVGHATRTPKQTIEHVTDDLDAATAILSARLITGGNELYEEFQDRLERHIAKNAKTLARKIVTAASTVQVGCSRPTSRKTSGDCGIYTACYGCSDWPARRRIFLPI